MTRTVRGDPGPGADWWGKRPLSGRVGKGGKYTHWWKRRLHKIERRQREGDE